LACPARQAIDEGKDREVELYVRHKEGHRIPVRVHITPIRDAAGKVVGAVQVFSDNYPKMELRKRLEDLQRQALLDPLTRLANRKGVEMYLKSRLGELQRFNWPFGVLFIDIDHFKHINDAFGHLIGDDVLRMVARSLLRSSRPFDIVGRWGGEEFLAIVANVDEKELTAIGERYRTVVYKSRLKRPAGIVRVSVSIGGTLCRKSDSLERLIERADGLMYRCKNAGRNCIRVAG
jgi:diguanylate cyclase (GGDEF)-like protein